MSEHNQPLSPQLHAWLSIVIRARDDLEELSESILALQNALPPSITYSKTCNDHLYMTRMSILAAHGWAGSSVEQLLFLFHSLSPAARAEIEQSYTQKVRPKLERWLAEWQKYKKGT